MICYAKDLVGGSYASAWSSCCLATSEMSVGISAAPAFPIWPGQDGDWWADLGGEDKTGTTLGAGSGMARTGNGE